MSWMILSHKIHFSKVWAMDRSEDRVETMKSLLDASGATNVSVFCGDFLKTNVADKKFAKVLCY